jgi:hypothetical protein
MSLKLIRQAQAVSRMGNTELELARHVQSVLKTPSLVEAFDASQFEVTPDHYNEWLSVMKDMAEEQGMSLDRKQAFNEIAFEVLDNDSFVDALASGDAGDAEQTKENIVKALWQAYQVNKAHARVSSHVGSKINQAQDDVRTLGGLVGDQEEETSGFAQDFAAAKGTEDEESMFPRRQAPRAHNLLSKAVALKKSRKNPFPAGSLRASIWADAYGEENEEGDDFDAAGSDSIDDLESGDFESDVDADSMSPDDLASRITGSTDVDIDFGEGEPDDDIDQRVDDLEQRVADLEQGEAGEDDLEGLDMPAGDRDSGSDVDLSSERQPAANLRTPTTAGSNDREYDEEEQVRDLFKRAITSPKQHMNDALKGEETAGSEAWKKLMLPKNPHPKDSPAHKAWLKGMKAAAKDSLGIVDKPMSTSKQKPKRR